MDIENMLFEEGHLIEEIRRLPSGIIGGLSPKSPCRVRSRAGRVVIGKDYLVEDSEGRSVKPVPYLTANIPGRVKTIFEGDHAVEIEYRGTLYEIQRAR